MSAFIVSKETLDKAVVVLAGLYGRSPKQPSPGELNDMGRRLWEMNRRAVAARYGKKAERNLPEYTFTHPTTHLVERQRLVGWYKAARCLLYQCDEGAVPEMALFHQLEAAANELAAFIVETLPEYEKAGWDS